MPPIRFAYSFDLKSESRTITGSGGVTALGGSVVFNATNSYTGATIVNTEGARKVSFSSPVTKRNVLDAAYQELDHYNVLTSALGAKPATKKIWIPDALFASEDNLLSGLVFNPLKGN